MRQAICEFIGLSFLILTTVWFAVEVAGAPATALMNSYLLSVPNEGIALPFPYSAVKEIP